MRESCFLLHLRVFPPVPSGLRNVKPKQPATMFRRRELTWMVGLVLISAGIWCSNHHRLRPSDWQVPAEYGLDPATADALMILAFSKAAAEGHYWPSGSKLVPSLGAPYVASWNDYPV